MNNTKHSIVILRQSREYGVLELKLKSRGFDIYNAPLFKYNFLPLKDIKKPQPKSVIIISSRAAAWCIRQLVTQLSNQTFFIIGSETILELESAGQIKNIKQFLHMRQLMDYLETKPDDIKSIHYYRGDKIKNMDFPDFVTSLNIQYNEQIVYTTSYIYTVDNNIKNAMKDPNPVGYVALSSLGAQHWEEMMFSHCLSNFYCKGLLFCLSKDIATATKIMPKSLIHIAPQPTTESLLELIINHYAKNNNGV